MVSDDLPVESYIGFKPESYRWVTIPPQYHVSRRGAPQLPTSPLITSPNSSHWVPLKRASRICSIGK